MCSTEHAPWLIIPSNHKWFRNLAISRIVAETLELLNMKFPDPTVDINEIKQKYHAIEQEERIGTEAAKADESESSSNSRRNGAESPSSSI
jgi:hypothetical protein